MTPKLAGRLMTASALLFGLAGLALLFAPEEFGSVLGFDSTAKLPVSMWGAGLVGFAGMNWTARASILGGIYGRAVVMGNQLHATVGILIFLTQIQVPGITRGWPLIGLVLVYGANAILFFILMTKSPKSNVEH